MNGTDRNPVGGASYTVRSVTNIGGTGWIADGILCRRYWMTVNNTYEYKFSGYKLVCNECSISLSLDANSGANSGKTNNRGRFLGVLPDGWQEVPGTEEWSNGVHHTCSDRCRLLASQKHELVEGQWNEPNEEVDIWF